MVPPDPFEELVLETAEAILRSKDFVYHENPYLQISVAIGYALAIIEGADVDIGAHWQSGTRWAELLDDHVTGDVHRHNALGSLLASRCLDIQKRPVYPWKKGGGFQ